jgi:large subunit ribosomal protein L35e
MTHLKTVDLRQKTKDELKTQLQDLRKELLTLRVQKSTQGPQPKFSKISIVRKSIARVLTCLNATQRDHLRLFYKDKKYLPLDLRVKKTRAIRRQLSPAQLSKKTLKQQKKAIHFSTRNYAVKA